MMWPILASINFLSAILSYAILSWVLAREHWRGRGKAATIAGIVFCAEIWLIPQALAIFVFHAPLALRAFWFADYLVTGFAIILLHRVTGSISRDLADAAQLDGCGSGRTFRHIIFPLVRRALLLLGLLLFLATWPEFFPSDFPLFARFRPPALDGDEVRPLVLVSVVSSLALVAIHFLSTKFSREKSRDVSLARTNRIFAQNSP